MKNKIQSSFILAVAVLASSPNSFGATVPQRKNLEIQKSKVALPTAILEAKKIEKKDFRLVKPPRSNSFYGKNTLEAQYERLVDEEIKKLYKFSQTYRKNANRGEIWLRLAERYIEKSRLIQFRKQDEFDQRMRLFEQKKTTEKPRLDLSLADDYYRKAVQLYEWFLRDFPKDKKVDQALYFLGYSYFELGKTSLGEKYYQQLVRGYPNSEYVSESYFALGEFYFENEKWQDALENYSRVIKKRTSRLYNFALYKAAWCYFRLNKTNLALKLLERVVYISQSTQDESDDGTRSVNRVKLGAEAIKDYVPFYAELNGYENAEQDFLKVAKKDSLVQKMLEQLAYIYADSGHKEGAKYLFHRLIQKNPNGEKAAEYQQQIVLSYLATEQHKELKEEMYLWITKFGPMSEWAQANKKNQTLLAETFKKQENTLRNRTLQLHQTAQNSRAKFSQGEAQASYKLYLTSFVQAPQYAQMRFYYGELLFDMAEYGPASEQYQWYIKNSPKGEFIDKALLNNVLALEKGLPTPEQIEQRRKELSQKNKKMPFDEKTKAFVDAANIYLKQMPKSEKAPDIRRMVGYLYYSHNYFDEAIVIFNGIVEGQAWGKESQTAAELMLDTYKLKEDIEGFRLASYKLLEKPEVKNSTFGNQLRENLGKAAFLEADKLSKSGDYAQSAKSFETFAVKNLNSKSGLMAAYNAANNYAKAGDTQASTRVLKAFLAAPSQDPEILKLKIDARNNLATVLRNSGSLSEAAQEFQLFAKENPKDPKSVAALYNAAIIWDSLNEYAKAEESYLKYQAAAKGKDRTEIFYNLGDLAYRRKQMGAARNYFEQYISTSPSSADNLIRSQYLIAEILRTSGKITPTKEAYQKTYGIYQTLKARGKATGVRYAAESKYRLAAESLEEMKRISLGTSEKSIMTGLTRMQELQKVLLKNMADVLRLDYGPYVVAAVLSEAQAYEIISGAFEKSPVPREYSKPEEAQQFKQLASQQASEFRNKAKAIYEKAYERAIQLDIPSEWTLAALRGVQKLNPQNPLLVGEKINEEIFPAMEEKQ